jgi:hypothetical protein
MKTLLAVKLLRSKFTPKRKAPPIKVRLLLFLIGGTHAIGKENDTRLENLV